MTVSAEPLLKKRSEQTAENVCLYDAQGNPIVLSAIGVFSSYAPSDFDDQAATKYYGYLAADGSWYIKQEDWATGAIRYFKGIDNYSTNWGNRAGLSYDYFDTIFG